MALDLFTGAAAGAVAGELLKAVLDAKDKALGLEIHLERLETTLASVIPHVHYIQQLDEELNRPSLELARLVLQLEKGKELIRKCSAVTCANYYKRRSYSERILKLDASLQRFFNMEMQVTMSRDVKETLKEVFALRQELCELRNKERNEAVLPDKQLQQVEQDHSVDLSNTSSTTLSEEDRGTGLMSLNSTKSDEDGLLMDRLSEEDRGTGLMSLNSTKSDEDGVVAAENKGRAKLGLSLKLLKLKGWNSLFRYNKEDKKSKVSKMANLGKGGAKLFSFRELRAATNNFSDDQSIGRGGYGRVFLGVLADGQKVAIKRTKRASEFKVELEILSRLHHRHVVRLVGFCDEIDNEGLLVYEFIENGSLSKLLHSLNLDEHKNALGSWEMRVKIAVDVARGIDYLHNYSVPCIIHRDITSSNILIDANWTAKIADCGLAVSMQNKDARCEIKSIVGTYGYMAPEYIWRDELTVKADVYALGVVLLELLTGKNAIEATEFEDCSTLPRYVAKLIKLELERGDWELKWVLDSMLKTPSLYELQALEMVIYTAMLDSRLKTPSLYELQALEMVIYTAMRCLDDHRPSIGEVVSNLESAWACFEDTLPDSPTQCRTCLHKKRPSMVELAQIVKRIS